MHGRSRRRQVTRGDPLDTADADRYSSREKEEFSLRRRTVHTPARIVVAAALVALVLLAPRVGRADSGGSGDGLPPLDGPSMSDADVSPELQGWAPRSKVDVQAILSSYNANIERALSTIDSLRVIQDMIEPQDDGSFRSARAMLIHRRESGMVRDEIRSELRYPAGEYTLESLVGPALAPGDYEVEIEGTEEIEGVLCHRLSVRALVRDVEHIDGTVCISVFHGVPVWISASVADPPFPVAKIKLDKRFGPAPGGLWLLRRHTGEVELGLIMGRKKGLRHIFYEDYVVNGETETDAQPNK
jgi:hypothetical protein